MLLLCESEKAGREGEGEREMEKLKAITSTATM